MAGQRWSREEVLAAFNLYLTTPFGRLHSRNLWLAIGIPVVAVIATIQSGASPPPPSLKLDVETRAGSESPRAE